MRGKAFSPIKVIRVYIQASRGQVTYDEDNRGHDVYDQLFCVNASNSQNPYKVTVQINGVNVSMEIDTGASTSVINQKTLRTLSQSGKVLNLNPVNVVLRTYTREGIPVVGKFELE